MEKEIPIEMFVLRVYRGTPNHQYWEEFELKRRPNANIISALMDIQKKPINRQGEKVTPVVWEQGCLEEVCGSCSMLVNGYPRQACTALIEKYLAESKKPIITLAPFTKFPLVRDLIVDRSRMFDHLKKVHAWVEADGSRGNEFGPLIAPETQEVMYQLSKCMTCGCCLEGCPQVNEKSTFMGPAVVSQVRLFDDHPTGKKERPFRLRKMLGEDGISGCSNAQNCVEVCPKEIPLTDSIAEIFRDSNGQALRDLFHLPDEPSKL